MDRKALLKDMKDSVGTQDPIVFFQKMVDVFDCLFDHIENLEHDLGETKTFLALAVHWDPKVASTMMIDQIRFLSSNKEDYVEELSKLKKAVMEYKVNQNYNDFCTFWEDTLGFHPFLRYR